MRNFIKDINNLKIFCEQYNFNFSYNINHYHKYRILYDIHNDNGSILEIIIIKNRHLHHITPTNIIYSIKINENNDRLNITELLLHKCETHNIKI